MSAAAESQSHTTRHTVYGNEATYVWKRWKHITFFTLDNLLLLIDCLLLMS